MDGDENFKRSSSHTRPTEFQMRFQGNVTNLGARQFLEEEGFIRPKTGNKRKHTSEAAVDSRQQTRPNQYASNLFKRSTFTRSPTPQPAERFKPPQPRQRARLEASRLQRSLEDDEVLQELRGKRRKTSESSDTAIPSRSSSVAKSPAGNRSSGQLQVLSARSNQSPDQRPGNSSTLMPTPQFKQPRSALSPALPTGQKSSQPTMDSRASSVETVLYQPIKNRPEIAPRTGRQHVNPNGSKLATTNDIQIPSIDRRLKDPPPDLESLNRLLQQVPGILTKLSSQQEKLIRDLATVVNTHRERIELLETHNTNLEELVSAKSKSFTEEMNTRFATMEQRMNDQMEQIADLRSDNKQLRRQIYGTPSVASVSDNQAALISNLTPQSDQANENRIRHQTSSQQPMSVFDEKYIYGDEQRQSQEPTSPFDEKYMDDYVQRESEGPTIMNNVSDERFNQEPMPMYEDIHQQNNHSEMNTFSSFDEYVNPQSTDLTDGLHQQGVQNALNALERESTPDWLTAAGNLHERNSQEPELELNGPGELDAADEAM